MNLSCDALLPISSASPRFSLIVLYPSSSFTSLCPVNQKDAEQQKSISFGFGCLGASSKALVVVAEDVFMKLFAK